MSLQQILSELYVSEINAGLQSFWDDGWLVYIGDNMNGYKIEQTFENGNFDAMAEWLESEAMRLYPDSLFAKKRLGRVRAVFEPTP